jgi:hypothetical protein
MPSYELIESHAAKPRLFWQPVEDNAFHVYAGGSASPKTDAKTIRRKCSAAKKTPPSGWPGQVKGLGGVPPLLQIKPNSGNLPGKK